MWFYADQARNCYCTTFEKSQKVLNWRRDPKATLLIESGIEYAELKGVVIYARTEVIEDREIVVDTAGKHKLERTQAPTNRIDYVIGRAALPPKRVAVEVHHNDFYPGSFKLGGRYEYVCYYRAQRAIATIRFNKFQ